MTASACGIELNPKQVVVRYGDSVSANCSASSCSQLVGIGWESTYGGTGLVQGVSQVPLQMKNVRFWVIKPQCYITLKNNEQKLEELKVTVYKMPEKVSMSQLPEPLVEGEDYAIECKISDVAPAGNLSVIWHKGEDIIQEETFDDNSDSPVTVSDAFFLTAHRNDAGNQIWCEARLNLESAEAQNLTMRSESNKISVIYAPAFNEPENETLEVSAGEKITLNCTAKGNPEPTYTWQFSHHSQEMDNFQSMKKPVLTPSFQLKGTYSCTASNSQGSVTKHFTVEETKGTQTTLIAILVIGLFVGVLTSVAGLLLVKPDGTFSCNKGNYQPTSPGII
ncbi:intercellular adhesion molecule 2-like isoform 2-T2 [Menidia menidia]